jgi:DNA-binding winged helix-turn-helix (wHTH) protein
MSFRKPYGASNQININKLPSPATTAGGPQHLFPSSPFLIGDWIVDPRRRAISRRGEVRVLEPRHMDVLCALAARPGAVLSTEELLDTCWHGGFLGDNPVHKSVAMLRRALGDDARSPRFIATIRKRGYLLVPRARPVRGVEERLECAMRRWGTSAAFQRRVQAIGPVDEEGWHTLTAALLRVASTLVTDGAFGEALGAVDEARDWLAAQVPVSALERDNARVMRRHDRALP